MAVDPLILIVDLLMVGDSLLTNHHRADPPRHRHLPNLPRTSWPALPRRLGTPDWKQRETGRSGCFVQIVGGQQPMQGWPTFRNFNHVDEFSVIMSTNGGTTSTDTNPHQPISPMIFGSSARPRQVVSPRMPQQVRQGRDAPFTRAKGDRGIWKWEICHFVKCLIWVPNDSRCC